MAQELEASPAVQVRHQRDDPPCLINLHAISLIPSPAVQAVIFSVLGVLPWNLKFFAAFVSVPLLLPFHCLSFHCLFTAFPPYFDLSLTFHCLSLTFHCLFT